MAEWITYNWWGLLFGVEKAPGELGPALAWVAEAQAAAWLDTLRQASAFSTDLDGLRRELETDSDRFGERAYRIGYRQAGLVRQALSLSPTEPVRLDQLPVAQVQGVAKAPSSSLQGVSVTTDAREHANLALGWPASRTSLLAVRPWLVTSGRVLGRLADDRLHGYRWERAVGVRVDLTPSREAVVIDLEGEPTLIRSGPGIAPMAVAAIFHLYGPGPRSSTSA